MPKDGDIGCLLVQLHRHREATYGRRGASGSFYHIAEGESLAIGRVCTASRAVDGIDYGRPFSAGHRQLECVTPGRHPTVLHELRSEEHTSELQSRENLVCRLLLEKKKTN